MDEKDVRAKADRIRADLGEAKRAFESGSEACRAGLRAFLPAIVAAHESVPETRLLRAPKIFDGSSWNPSARIVQEGFWHSYDSDWYPNPPFISADFGARISYDPFAKTWRCTSEGHPKCYGTTQLEILDWYTDRLAEWLIHSYPKQKELIEAEIRAEEARRLEEENRKHEIGPWEARQRRELIQILINFGLAILGFFALYAFLMSLLSG